MQDLKKPSNPRWLQHIDWKLLVFLILFLNVKILVKIAAVILLLLLNRKMFREKSIYRQKFIWFYFSMIVIAVINLLLHISSISTNYLIAVSVGIIFWLICIAAAFMNSWFVAKTDPAKLHSTITFFFILNAAVTIGQLLLIILDTGSVNPYAYQGMHQKYFSGTGDFLTGISFDVSSTNALLNAFGIVFFLCRNKINMVLLCMAVLLLTASNFTNLLLVPVLVFLFIFQSTKEQKSSIVVCLLLIVVFMTKISPQNIRNITEAYGKIFNKSPVKITAKTGNIPVTEKPDSLLTADERKQKTALLFLDSLNKARIDNLQKEISGKGPGNRTSITIIPTTKPTIPRPSIHTEPFQKRKDTTLHQKILLDFAIKDIAAFDTSLRQIKGRHLPGKLIAVRQTFNFLKKHPHKILTGDGMGNFSSKLAFRITGLQIAGGYPQKFTYINNDFLNNHLNLYLSYFSKDAELHSLINSPNNVYDQLLAEYGLAGIFCFIVLYLAFFIKRIKRLTYGIPLLLLFAGILGVDYWFEQLSVLILFELLMLLNMKETKEK